MDLNALLGNGMVDPVVLRERLFQELQDRLASHDTFADISAKPPEDLLATAFGSWLARIIDNDGTAIADRPGVGRGNAQELYEELSDRNVVLAAALGACDSCWGTNFECPLCNGAGAPGWVLPDEQLYEVFVRPAVRAVTNARD